MPGPSRPWARSSERAGVKRSLSIDTYRGVGVSLVLWTHAGLPGVPGSFIAIDGFFVISGYLVTLSFLRQLDRLEGNDPRAGRWSRYARAARHFAEARVRRILLPLLATLLLTLLAGWLVLLPADLNDLADAALMSVLLSGNLHAAGGGDYFDAASNARPLLHSWSLALEEQFYLMSLALMAVFALLRRPWAFWVVTMGGLLASLTWAQAMSSDPATHSQAYYLFSTRVWEFLLGVALATLVTCGHLEGRLGRWLSGGLAYALGWAVMAASILLLTPAAPSPGLISVPAMLGVCLILLGQPRSRLLSQGMHLRPFVAAGRNVYGIYLVHLPVIVYLGYAAPPLGPWSGVAAFVLSYAVALALGALIELPFDRWRRPRFRWILLADGVLVAVILGLCAMIWQGGGVPERMPEAAQRAYLAKFLLNPERARCMEGELTTTGYSCTYGPPSDRKMVLIGDSHSDMLASPLAKAFATQGRQLVHYWSAECAPVGSAVAELGAFSARCAGLATEAHAQLARMPGVEGVIYAVLWPWYLGYGPQELPRHLVESRGAPVGSVDPATYRAGLMAQFRRTVEGLTAQGLHVYIVSPVPIHGLPLPEEAALNLWYRPEGWRANLQDLTRADYDAQGEMFRQMVGAFAGRADVTVLDSAGVLCPGERCEVWGEGSPLYYDDNHLNELGASALVQSWFK